MGDKPTVVELLSAVMAEVQSVGKTGRNTEQGYNFRGVDAVVNAVGPVLRQHGVIVLPVLEEATLRDVRTSRDKPARESTVRVRYRFYGPAGDSVDAVVPGESMDTGDKGMAKAMSVAYRILWLQALCIPTDDPDPDTQSHERGDEAAVTHQEALDLFAVIMNARDSDALRAAYDAVVEAVKEQRLSDREATRLIAHIKKRKAEFDSKAADNDAEPRPGSSTATSPPAEEPVPTGLTDRSRRRMFALFGELGMGGNDEEAKQLRRVYCSGVLEVEVEHVGALSEGQARTVVRALEERKKAGVS